MAAAANRWDLSAPQYEILLCVQDQDDPAIDVCKKLLAKYPGVDAYLFIGEVAATAVAPLPRGRLLACSV